MDSSADNGKVSDCYSGKPSGEMQLIIDELIRNNPDAIDPTLLPPEEGREVALLASLDFNRNLPEMAQVESLTLTGAADNALSARLYTPEDCQDGLIFYIHGGGFVLGDIDTHERFCRCLSIETACPLLSVNYRLAPEHPFPAGLKDCVAIYRQLETIYSSFPWTRGTIAIAGDSAGANLALALIIHEQAESNPAPQMGLLFYGVFGTDFTTRSYEQFANGPGLTRGKMSRYLDWYATPDQLKHSLVSINTSSDEILSRLPPLYMNAAEIDPVCSDTEVLFARLLALGRDDKLDIVPGVVHGFLQMTNNLEAARVAIKDAANAFREILTLTNIK